MNFLTLIQQVWQALPKKVTYTLIATLLLGAKSKWPGLPLPDTEWTMAILGVLLGTHTITDVTSMIAMKAERLERLKADEDLARRERSLTAKIPGLPAILVLLTLSGYGCGNDALAQNYQSGPAFDSYQLAPSEVFITKVTVDMNSLAQQIIYTVPAGPQVFVPTRLFGFGGTALANVATCFLGRNGATGNIANVGGTCNFAPTVLAGGSFAGYSSAMAPLNPSDTLNFAITTGNVSGTRNLYLFGTFFNL